jgi:hypothetical protein
LRSSPRCPPHRPPYCSPDCPFLLLSRSAACQIAHFCRSPARLLARSLVSLLSTDVMSAEALADRSFLLRTCRVAGWIARFIGSAVTYRACRLPDCSDLCFSPATPLTDRSFLSLACWLHTRSLVSFSRRRQACRSGRGIARFCLSPAARFFRYGERLDRLLASKPGGA